MNKEQILIVDDEEVNRALLEMMFISDYDILQAANGREAIEQIKHSENLVLILLDIVMLYYQWERPV